MTTHEAAELIERVFNDSYIAEEFISSIHDNPQGPAILATISDKDEVVAQFYEWRQATGRVILN